MTSFDNMNLEDVQTLSANDLEFLDSISPVIETYQPSTFYPIIVSLIIAVLAWTITSSYFTKYFENVKYLPVVQAGIIFSAVLISILFLI